jgi:hypothetical protein
MLISQTDSFGSLYFLSDGQNTTRTLSLAFTQGWFLPAEKRANLPKIAYVKETFNKLLGLRFFVIFRGNSLFQKEDKFWDALLNS